MCRAGPGSKARAWAGLCQAWAFQNVKPGPHSGLGPGPGRLGLGPGLSPGVITLQSQARAPHISTTIPSLPALRMGLLFRNSTNDGTAFQRPSARGASSARTRTQPWTARMQGRSVLTLMQEQVIHGNRGRVGTRALQTRMTKRTIAS